MAVNERQFSLLNEMGIQLWQRRALPLSTPITDKHVNIAANKDSDDKRNTNSELIIDFQKLSKTPLFLDIINCLSVSVGEVTCLNNVLNLGLINWQFHDDDEASIISLDKNLLVTPPFAIISQSSQLKRQLWQTIQTQDIS